MSAIGDALRALAVECDKLANEGVDTNIRLRGVIFVMQGELSISLGHCNDRQTDREGVVKMTEMAHQAALHGTMKAATPEQILQLATILAGQDDDAGG